VSRYSRAALVVFAVVVGVLLMLHAVSPQWMASVSHAIHGR
jgi:hypothetical protein